MKRLILTVIISLLMAMTASAQTSGRTLDGLNLRAEASFGDNILLRIPIDSRIAINGRNGDGAWLQVTYNGVSGWVSSTYVKWNSVGLMNFPVSDGTFSAPPQPNVAVSDSAFAVQVTTRLNVRSEPTLTNNIITTLSVGQSGVATGRSRDGAWVSIDTGLVRGWVAGAFLSSNVDLMGLPVTSDFFGASVETLPELDPIAAIIISDNGQYTLTGPAVGNSSSYDVEITLEWGSTANLDLRVIGPDGYLITPGRGQSPTGGFFQQFVGANENCITARDGASEVVTWRLGTAPSGVYTIQVEHVNSCNVGAEDRTRFWVRVNNDGPEAFFYIDSINPSDFYEFAFVRP